MEAPEDYLFSRSTSLDTVYEAENPNADRSKNTALIPPGFGTATSYLPGSGEALTPNLIPGALSGGLVNQVGSVNYPAIDTSTPAPISDSNFSCTTAPITTQATNFTEVTSDLYYSGGHLGTLNIPSIGLSVRVYEGTDSTALKRGVGHFSETSVWSGNVALGGHNRGVNTYFGQIHTLKQGSTIILTTKLGTRTYAVTSVEKVSETDTSGLTAASGNQITLYTCVRDQSAYRWCVKGVEI